MSDQVQDDVVGTTVEQQLLTDTERFYVTIPARTADALGLKNGEPIGFVPRLEQGTIVLDVERGSNPDHGHVMRLHRPRDAAHLRFPNELAHEREFPDLLAGDDEVLVDVEVASESRLTLRFWPESWPWTPVGGVDSDAGDVAGQKRKRLTVEKSGPGTEFEQFRLYWPSAFVERYGLAAGDRVAFRLTARDGQLGVAALMPTGRHEYDWDATYTRSVTKNDAVGGGDAENAQFRSVFPKVWADSLRFRGNSLVLEPEREFVFIHRS